jgi:hypothetical protein
MMNYLKETEIGRKYKKVTKPNLYLKMIGNEQADVERKGSLIIKK